jgi:hypothetical protein
MLWWTHQLTLIACRRIRRSRPFKLFRHSSSHHHSDRLSKRRQAILHPPLIALLLDQAIDPAGSSGRPVCIYNAGISNTADPAPT